MFAIWFEQETCEEEGEEFFVGGIEIGELSESFIASTSLWEKAQYEHQWQTGVARIVSGECARSCLVTSIYPDRKNHLFWWLLYRDGLDVVFQQAIFFHHRQPAGFGAAHIYAAIPERGEDPRVSEWRLPITDLERFLAAARPNPKS